MFEQVLWSAQRPTNLNLKYFCLCKMRLHGAYTFSINLAQLNCVNGSREKENRREKEKKTEQENPKWNEHEWTWTGMFCVRPNLFRCVWSTRKSFIFGFSSTRLHTICFNFFSFGLPNSRHWIYSIAIKSFGSSQFTVQNNHRPRYYETNRWACVKDFGKRLSIDAKFNISIHSNDL